MRQNSARSRTSVRLTAYDALSRVVTQVERVGGSPILTIVDAYDSAGRKISQLRDAVLTSYTYDTADRLTGQQVAGAFATFTMDAVGNITVKSQQGSSPITMTYNAGSRLVTSVEGAVVSTYTFDANGNQTAVNAGGSRTTYAYDYENRMRTAIDPGGARSTMAYWADGMRRFLEVGGTRTTFVWDGSDYLQSRTPSEVTTFSTVDAQILDSEVGGSESLLVPDPLGSVVKVLDASGNQVYDAAYWPYGEIRNSIGVNDTSWGYGGTWGYHFDMSRRLYIRARVLDPVAGRWYSVDPLWPYDSAYGYVRARTQNMIDFLGLSPSKPGSRVEKATTQTYMKGQYSIGSNCSEVHASSLGMYSENSNLNPSGFTKIGTFKASSGWTDALKKILCAYTCQQTFPHGGPALDACIAACNTIGVPPPPPPNPCPSGTCAFKCPDSKGVGCAPPGSKVCNGTIELPKDCAPKPVPKPGQGSPSFFVAPNLTVGVVWSWRF